MTHSEKVKLARNMWKSTKLGKLYHAYNVLMARGWYLSDKRELARVRRLEVKIQEVEHGKASVC